MAINYNDSRFQAVEEEKQQALANANNTYDNMINETDSYYEPMKAAAEEYGNKQAEIQQAQTDLAIERIENAKDDAAKSYTKEQKGAYVDWQKQSNQYGAEAERLASAGLLNSGYSETSQIGMYTAYQNRVSQARDTYQKAVTEYDLAIKDAQIANSAALAEIGFKALQTKLELGLNQFQYKNNLIQEKLATTMSIDNMYYGRKQDVVNQINTENALAEQRRQYNNSMRAYQLQNGGDQQLVNGGTPTDNDGVYKDPNATVLDKLFGDGNTIAVINGKEAQRSGYQVRDIFAGQIVGTSFGKQPIYKQGSSYYVADPNSGNFINVTSQVNESVKNQYNIDWGR